MSAHTITYCITYIHNFSTRKFLTHTCAPVQDDKFATFVVMLPNDNFQWTYKLKVSFPK